MTTAARITSNSNPAAAVHAATRACVTERTTLSGTTEFAFADGSAMWAEGDDYGYHSCGLIVDPERTASMLVQS